MRTGSRHRQAEAGHVQQDNSPVVSPVSCPRTATVGSRGAARIGADPEFPAAARRQHTWLSAIAAPAAPFPVFSARVPGAAVGVFIGA